MLPHLLPLAPFFSDVGVIFFRESEVPVVSEEKPWIEATPDTM